MAKGVLKEATTWSQQEGMLAGAGRGCGGAVDRAWVLGECWRGLARVQCGHSGLYVALVGCCAAVRGQAEPDFLPSPRWRCLGTAALTPARAQA